MLKYVCYFLGVFGLFTLLASYFPKPPAASSYPEDAAIFELIGISGSMGILTGTGFRLNTDKGQYIVTAGHVCAADDEPIVIDQFMLKQHDKIVGVRTSYIVKPVNDLCFIKEDSTFKGPALNLAPKKGMPNDLIHAIGYPRGVFYKASGIILQDVNYDQLLTEAFITADSGASGEPILNEKNEVVGVLVRVRFPQKYFSYFVPVDLVKEAINEL